MSDVSRGTAERPARWTAFPALEAYAEILTTRGVDRGLIGPREVERLWPRHLDNCAAVALDTLTPIPTGASVADVGSGAGLPGLVWAIVRPDISVTLVEPLLRRATFLTEVVQELGLGARVTVLRARAEDVRRRDFDVVTARAVARLDRLVEWTLPLCRVGGRVVAFKGSSAAEEIAEAGPVIGRLGGGPTELMTFGAEGGGQPSATVIVLHRTGEGRTRRRPSRPK